MLLGALERSDIIHWKAIGMKKHSANKMLNFLLLQLVAHIVIIAPKGYLAETLKYL
jgi:hypothetical protein